MFRYIITQEFLLLREKELSRNNKDIDIAQKGVFAQNKAYILHENWFSRKIN